jgi:hypothetical protein
MTTQKYNNSRWTYQDDEILVTWCKGIKQWQVSSTITLGRWDLTTKAAEYSNIESLRRWYNIHSEKMSAKIIAEAIKKN